MSTVVHPVEVVPAALIMTRMITPLNFEPSNLLGILAIGKRTKWT
jgi:hypothetical protein